MDANAFQYSNCIGRIILNTKINHNELEEKFQYSNCIGRIIIGWRVLLNIKNSTDTIGVLKQVERSVVTKL